MRDAAEQVCLGNCLVDIIFFLYKMGESMLEATMRPYIVQTVCRDFFNGNETYCKSLKISPMDVNQIQTKGAQYLVYYRILVNLPAMFLGLLCGAWSDRNGRKLPMMMPSLGSVFSVLFYLASLMANDWSLHLIMIGAFVQGSFGKSAVITMAVNCYVSDITRPEDRTNKFGKLLGMNFFGLTCGALLSGLLQDVTDYNLTLTVAVIIHALVVLATVFLVKDTVTETKLEAEKEDKKPYYCDFFRFSNIVESCSVLVRKRVGYGRSIIVILCVISLTNMSCKAGEIDTTVLFVEREPFNWTESLFAYLLSIDYAMMGFCLVFILPLMSTGFGIQDVTIILLGCICKIARCTWGGLATESWMIYAATVVGSFAGMMASAIRSAVSKEVDENELGKAFAILSVAETLAKLLGTLVFTNIYSATTSFYPGFTFFVEAFTYLLLFAVTMWLAVLYQRNGKTNFTNFMSRASSYGSMNFTKKSSDNKGNEVDELVNEKQAAPQPLTATTP